MNKGYSAPPQPCSFQDKPSKPNITSGTTHRTLVRAGLFGLMIALSLKLIWMSTDPILHLKTAHSVEDASSHPDKTVLLTRSFADEETFLVMDYSPWLGFNNMRYMIERGLYLADLLNRTLVLPNHLRIRRCSDEAVCARTAVLLDLDAIGRNEQGSTMALDLGYFFDLPHLSEHTGGRVTDLRTFMEKVVGVPQGAALIDSQFGAQIAFWQDRLRYEQPGQPLDVMDGYRAKDDEEGDEEYPEVDLKRSIDGQGGIQGLRNVSIYRVNRATWDLEDREDLSVIDNLIRNGLVDSLEEPSENRSANDSGDERDLKVKRSFYAFSDVRGGGLERIVEWSLFFRRDQDDQTKEVPELDRGSCDPPTEDPSVENTPWEARFPAFATCRIEHYVGLKQELGRVTDRILSIEGQFHTAGWMPIIYSSIAGAEKYRTMATTFLRYAPAVQEAAEYMMGRLKVVARERQATRMATWDDSDLPVSSWFHLSMHVRRGDFVEDKHGWQKFDDAWMGSLVKEAVESIFPPSNLSDLNGHSVPQGAGFYVATDESSPQVIGFFHALGGILFEDLIDSSFEQRFGHLVVYDDWVGLVEQVICAQSNYFYGTMTSSFTSGIVNMRVALDQKDNLRGSFNRGNFAYLIKKGGPLLTTEQESLGTV